MRETERERDRERQRVRGRQRGMKNLYLGVREGPDGSGKKIEREGERGREREREIDRYEESIPARLD